MYFINSELYFFHFSLPEIMNFAVLLNTLELLQVTEQFLVMSPVGHWREGEPRHFYCLKG